MPASASIRDLRNRFPEVRRILESEGEVLLTEGGKARYRLISHTPVEKTKVPRVDFWSRLTAYQPNPISADEARALHEDDRADR